MFDEDKFDKWRRMFDEWDEAAEAYENFRKARAEFTHEMIQTLGEITYEFFSGDLPSDDILDQDKLDAETVKKQVASIERLSFEGQEIFEQLERCVVTFSDEDVPDDAQIMQYKFSYKDYSESAIKKRMQQDLKYLEDQFLIKFNEEEVKTFQENSREQEAYDKFHQDFQILIHNTLKKLALKYYPEIMELNSTGFREVDSILHYHMCEILEPIWIMYPENHEDKTE